MPAADNGLDAAQLQSERDMMQEQLSEAHAVVEQLRNDIRV